MSIEILNIVVEHTPCNSWILSCQALHPCNSPGKNTAAGATPLLQGIFLTQDWNLGFHIAGDFTALFVKAQISIISNKVGGKVKKCRQNKRARKNMRNKTMTVD